MPTYPGYYYLLGTQDTKSERGGKKIHKTENNNRKKAIQLDRDDECVSNFGKTQSQIILWIFILRVV